LDDLKQKYDQFAQVISCRRWVVASVIGAAVLASPLLAHVTRPTYQASSEIASVANGPNAAVLLPTTDIAALAMSGDVLKRAATSMRSSATVDDLRSALKVRGTPSSNIITVTARSKNGPFALALSNAVADSTVSAYRGLSGHQYGHLIDSLHKQLQEQQDFIAVLDKKLQEAAQTDVLAASSHPLDTITSRLTELQSQRSQAESVLVADSASASTETAADSKNQAALTQVVSAQALANDPYYQSLLAGEAKDAAQYQFQRAAFTSHYPGLAGLQAQVTTEKTALNTAASESVAKHIGSSNTYATVVAQRVAAEAQVAGDKARLSSIDDEISATQQQLRDLPTQEVSANQLRLEHDSAAQAYQQLETRLQMTLADQQQALSLSSLVVLDYATNPAPVMPRGRLIFVLAALIFGLAIGAAYLAEALNPRLRERETIETVYGRPLLGTIGS
jgi:uncharacterized protein involved in exopolysaccharide biosynthesis